MPQSWESYIREEERKHEYAALGGKVQRCLKEILSCNGAETVDDLARNAYKYTDCGATVGALLWRGEDNAGEWVYSDNLRSLSKFEFITALSVSSIVEGVEQTTQKHIVDLLTMRGPKSAARAYAAALDAVEKEADEIWKETHGCPTCAKHFGNVASNGIETCEGDDGMTPIWKECPECKGYGTAI